MTLAAGAPPIGDELIVPPRSENSHGSRASCALVVAEHGALRRGLRASGLLAALCVLCLFSSSALADEGLTSLRSAGMGDNVVAASAGNAGVFHNPAGLAAIPIYSIEAGYDLTAGDGTHRLGLSVADSQTNGSVAGGLAYTFSLNNGDLSGDVDNLRDHNMRVALAVPLSEAFSVGVTGQYFIFSRGRVDQSEDGDKIRYNGFSLNIGAMARLGERFFVGVAAEDLVEVEGATGPRTLRAGAGFFNDVIRGQFEYGAQFLGADTRHRIGFGTELMLEMVAVRVGYRHITDISENELSIGLGYRSRTFGIDMAFRQPFNDRSRRQFGVTFLGFIPQN